MATLIDFTFKGIVTRDVPQRELARVFASVSLGSNVGAMLLQVTVVSRLIQRLVLQIISGGHQRIHPLIRTDFPDEQIEKFTAFIPPMAK